MSIAIFCSSLQTKEPEITCSDVSKSTRQRRPIFHGPIGDWLRTLREDREWSVQRVVNTAKNKGHKALTWNKLTLLEAGKTQFPDAGALRALADVYDLSYPDLVARFVASGYDLPDARSDLSSHSRTRGSALHPAPGGVDGTAAARIRELGTPASRTATKGRRRH